MTETSSEYEESPILSLTDSEDVKESDPYASAISTSTITVQVYRYTGSESSDDRYDSEYDDEYYEIDQSSLNTNVNDICESCEESLTSARKPSALLYIDDNATIYSSEHYDEASALSDRTSVKTALSGRTKSPYFEVEYVPLRLTSRRDREISTDIKTSDLDAPTHYTKPVPKVYPASYSKPVDANQFGSQIAEYDNIRKHRDEPTSPFHQLRPKKREIKATRSHLQKDMDKIKRDLNDVRYFLATKQPDDDAIAARLKTDKIEENVQQFGRELEKIKNILQEGRIQVVNDGTNASIPLKQANARDENYSNLEKEPGSSEMESGERQHELVSATTSADSKFGAVSRISDVEGIFTEKSSGSRHPLKSLAEKSRKREKSKLAALCCCRT